MKKPEKRQRVEIDVSKLKVEDNIKFFRKYNTIENSELINFVNNMKNGQSVFLPLPSRNDQDRIRMRLRNHCIPTIRTTSEPDGLRVWVFFKKEKN